MQLGTTRGILQTTIMVAGGATAIALLAGEPASAIGFGIGASLGVFSLLSLTLVVPRLCRQPGPSSLAGLGLLLMAKTPIYAIVLFYAMTSPIVNAVAVFAGVGILPCVVAWSAISGSPNVRGQLSHSAGSR